MIVQANKYRRMPEPNSATITVQTGDDLNVDSGGTVTVDSGGAVTVTGTLTIPNTGAMTVASGGTLTISSGGTLTVAGTLATTGTITQAQTHVIPLTDFRVFDAPTSLLPAAAANDDMGLIGTGASAAQTLQGVDFGGVTSDEKGMFVFALPPSYKAAGTVTVNLHAGMLTTVSDGTATIDVRAFSDDGDGTISADICATAAQSINSLTLATKAFTITPTALTPGMLLYIFVDMAGSDTGNLGVMIPTVTKVSIALGA
ncbi:MAG: hypothetical protein MN733_43455 [Nitrososphaera sp.]|nr:hypothetical protein [Nitrososphaera sp.]